MPKLFSGKILIAVIAATVLDLCVLPVFGALRPVLAYLLVAYAVLFAENRGRIVGMALLAGGLRDLAGIEPLGVETAVLLLNALVLGFVVPKIERESTWMRVCIVFIFIMTVFLFRLTVSAFLTGANAIPSDYLSAAFSSALTTALISPFFFYLFQAWLGGRSMLKQYELFR